MWIEVKSTKATKGGSSNGGRNDNEGNDVINVIKEHAKLRSKIWKDKKKRNKLGNKSWPWKKNS